MGDGGRRFPLTEPTLPRHPWRETAAAGIAAVASLLVAAGKAGAPGSLSSLWGTLDLTTTYAAARTMQSSPWVSPNHDLGFPFGQDLSNFPAPDVLNLAALKALALLTHDPLAAGNAFLLLSFGAIAIAAFALFRVAGTGRVLAAALAFSVTLLPWHFDRFTHAFLANYSTVAIGLILVVAVLDWNLALGGPQRARGRTLLIIGALGLYVGLTGTYYAVFTTILALVALGFQVLLGRRGRSLIGAVWFALLPTVVTFAAAYAYKLTALAPGASAAGRAPEESQLYAGDLFTLLRTTGLWSSAGPIPLLETVPTVASRLEADARNSTIGVLAVAVAFLACGVLLAANGRFRVPVSVRRLGQWPWLFLVALLFFVVGGFGQAFSVFLGYQIRSWGRLSIVVVLIAYVILGLALASLQRRAGPGRRGRAARVIVVAVIVVVTVADVASMRAPFDRAAAAEAAEQLRAYGRDLDAALPRGCGVLTVPGYEFPEGIPGDGTSTYDPLLPYLFSDHARWSYGGVRGSRQGDWPVTAISRDLPTAVRQARAAGMCAVQVDTKAFDSPGAPVATLTALLGRPVATSPDSRWMTFSLDSAEPGPWTPDYVLAPVTAQFGFGFDAAVTTADAHAATTLVPDATVVLVNPRPEPVRGTFEALVDAHACAIGDEAVLTTSAARVAVTTAAQAEVSLDVVVPGRGRSVVHVAAPPGCAVTVTNPRLVPAG